MVYQQSKTDPTPPDLALALGAYRISDAAIHARLTEFADSFMEPALPIEELRRLLQEEMGERILSEEIRRLRDKE